MHDWLVTTTNPAYRISMVVLGELKVDRINRVMELSLMGKCNTY